MASTFASVQKEIQRLQQHAEELRRDELKVVIEKVKSTVAKHKLTIVDIFGEHNSQAASATTGQPTAKAAKASKPAKAPKAAKAVKAAAPGKVKRAKAKGAGEAKYIHPKTGATWTGFGRAPAWIAKVRDRTKFLINAEPSTPAAKTAKPAKAAKTTPAKAPVVAKPAAKAAKTAKTSKKAAQVGKATAKASTAVKADKTTPAAEPTAPAASGPKDYSLQ